MTMASSSTFLMPFFLHTWGRHRQPQRQRRQEELVCPSREEKEDLKEGWDGKVKLHDIKVVVHRDPGGKRRKRGQRHTFAARTPWLSGGLLK
jgi:hypothetical protein